MCINFILFFDICNFEHGGGGEIRTLERYCYLWTFSKRLVSATHPLLHCDIDITDCIEYSIFLK